MVYVIQHWDGTNWANARFDDGSPMFFLTMRNAKRQLEKLDTSTHRIIPVKD